MFEKQFLHYGALGLAVIIALALNLTYFTKPVPFRESSPPATINPEVKNLSNFPGPEISSSIDSREYTPPPLNRNYSYCVEVRDVSESYLPDLEEKLAETYADGRGWSLGGAIKLTKLPSNCNFKVILAAAADLPVFSSICSTMWSCTVNGQVIINFDRWTEGSPSWTGSLSDYRAMVINHETGHWLGFGHAGCPALGESAPVMMQQSIALQGCRPNPWPLDSERQILANRYGIKL